VSEFRPELAKVTAVSRDLLRGESVVIWTELASCRVTSKVFTGRAAAAFAEALDAAAAEAFKHQGASQ
jgi:uncharacterized protein YheU (UPF0270 family)